MGNYEQFFARIGTGLAVVGCVVWLLWPDDWSRIEPEPLYALAVSLAVWIMAEVNKSGLSPKITVEQGSLPLEPRKISQNDVRVARQVWRFHARTLRGLLHETDLWSFVPIEQYDILSDFVNRVERNEVFFNHPELSDELDQFIASATEFLEKIAVDTVPELIGGQWVKGYKPFEIVSDERYRSLRAKSIAANALAATVWQNLDALLERIRAVAPETFDYPLDDMIYDGLHQQA